MARHRLAPAPTKQRRRRVHILDLVDARDRLIHFLTPDAHAAGLLPNTDYVALCGAVILPAPLVEPGLVPCRACKSVISAIVPSQRRHP